jgi:hypothetical protein
MRYSTGPAVHPRRARNLGAVGDDRYDVRDSRSVRTPWVWRGFLLMSLVAAGITIVLAGNGSATFAVLWGVIAAGWFGIAMWLWRMHTQMLRGEHD